MPIYDEFDLDVRLLDNNHEEGSWSNNAGAQRTQSSDCTNAQFCTRVCTHVGCGTSGTCVGTYCDTPGCDTLLC